MISRLRPRLRSVFLALTGATLLAAPFGLATPAGAQTKLKLVLNWKYQGPQGMFFSRGTRGHARPGQRLGRGGAAGGERHL